MIMHDVILQTPVEAIEAQIRTCYPGFGDEARYRKLTKQLEGLVAATMPGYVVYRIDEICHAVAIRQDSLMGGWV